MNKKIALIIVFLAAAVGIVIGIRSLKRESHANAFEVNMYFLNETSSSLTAEKQNIKYDNDEDIITLVTEALIKGASGSKSVSIMDKNTKLRDNNDLSLSAELSCMEVCCRYVFSSVKEELSCIDAQIQCVLNKTKEKIPITDTDLGFMKTSLFSGLSDKKHSASINGLFFPMTSIFGRSIPVPPPLKITYILP